MPLVGGDARAAGNFLPTIHLVMLGIENGAKANRIACAGGYSPAWPNH
jgi:hypothetical protein